MVSWAAEVYCTYADEEVTSTVMESAIWVVSAIMVVSPIIAISEALDAAAAAASAAVCLYIKDR